MHTPAIVLPFMSCLFWTAVYVLDWRIAHPSRRVLTVFMAVCTVLYLCHTIFFIAPGGMTACVADVVYAFCNLAVYPLYYMYICRLTSGRPLPTTWFLASLLPAVLVCLWAAVAYSIGVPHSWRIAAGKAIFIVQLLYVCVYGFRRLSRFDNRIANYYSDTEAHSVNQTRRMMAVLVVCSLASAIASSVGRDYFAASESLLFIPSVAFAVLLFCVGYVGMRQELWAGDMEDEPDETALSDNLSAECHDDTCRNDALFEHLDRLMQQERLYLQPDLRLSDVALALGVGRTTLSSTINQLAGMSFSDYVNAFRVQHAQRLLADQATTRRMSIMHIGESSGFATESSFYRAFRKYTGLTPKQWAVQEHLLGRKTTIRKSFVRNDSNFTP